jgi:hypothetical protein
MARSGKIAEEARIDAATQYSEICGDPRDCGNFQVQNRSTLERDHMQRDYLGCIQWTVEKETGF